MLIPLLQDTLFRSDCASLSFRLYLRTSPFSWWLWFWRLLIRWRISRFMGPKEKAATAILRSLKKAKAQRLRANQELVIARRGTKWNAFSKDGRSNCLSELKKTPRLWVKWITGFDSRYFRSSEFKIELTNPPFYFKDRIYNRQNIG